VSDLDHTLAPTATDLAQIDAVVVRAIISIRRCGGNGKVEFVFEDGLLVSSSVKTTTHYTNVQERKIIK